MESQVTVYPAELACSLLGIPNTCTVPMPEVSSLKPGEVVLWYPGCTLTQLRNSPIGKERMRQEQDWYDQKNYSAEPGYYAVQLRVPDSNRKNWQKQKAQLAKAAESFQPASAAVAALALLLHLKETGNNLLQSEGCRCMEEAARGYCVILTVSGSRVHVDVGWDVSHGDSLWLAAARKF